MKAETVSLNRGVTARRWQELLPYAALVLIVTIPSLPALLSAVRLNHNAYFCQYAARHEALHKSILEQHVFPLRSHWLGGGNRGRPRMIHVRTGFMLGCLRGGR